MLELLDGGRWRATIAALEFPPQTMRAFVSGHPLGATLRLSGELRGAGGALEGSLEGHVGTGRVRVTAAIDSLAPPTGRVELEAWTTAGPLRLSARANRGTVESMELHAALPGGRLEATGRGSLSHFGRVEALAFRRQLQRRFG